MTPEDENALVDVLVIIGCPESVHIVIDFNHNKKE